MSTQHFYPKYDIGQLHPECVAVLEHVEKADEPPLSALTPAQARESFLEPSWLGPMLRNIRLTTCEAPGPNGPIPLRIYTPDGNTPFPLIIFFHGGGFVCGSAAEFDPVCSGLAATSKAVVISVDYRLAPEFNFPAPVEDANAAAAWIAENAAQFKVDPDKIAVAGDSAGANMATNAAIYARNHGVSPYCAQVLICPWVDLSGLNTDSYRWFGDGLWLSTENIQWYRDHYLSNTELGKSPLASPLLETDLTGLPPALVILAEFDVLFSEGQSYARRLESAGVPVAVSNYKGMLHDFVVLPGKLSTANTALKEIGQYLITAFNKRTG
ncbi:MAG: alpha/beta hydrolase [Desulfobacteraceae bacterium]|nr:alpha/beta hydrolase [Desulfobacteraceae bacterium]